MLITRTGRHYPNPKWAIWRDRVVAGIREICNPTPETMIDKPCSMSAIYTPYDRKRRDTPAMLDALYHCFERAELITDDFLIKQVAWGERELDKKNAGVSIVLEEI